MAICGAKTRAGGKCKNAAMENGRCRLHGGKSTGAPAAKMKGNQNAVRHGFFRRIFPDDAETLEIISEIDTKSPLDILWENIVIQYTAIVRAQRIMWVQDHEDHSEFVIAESSGIDSETVTKMVQPAWDKQRSFLEAQSRAMASLERMITRYEEMLPDGLRMEEQRLKLAKLKADIERVSNPDGEDVEDWITALETVAERRRKRNRGGDDGEE
ncbi:phage terminase small subunit [Alicyclobacillus acidoterrestris]|uniref:phage terminase small subunit n=1 Tax=Alicyclobacillus acidoterrestris TaxID=1450 RepID=UPI003F533A43